jgi:outer membrane lipoprotein-sorting protein
MSNPVMAAASTRLRFVLFLIAVSFWSVNTVTSKQAFAASFNEVQEADLRAASRYLNSVKSLKSRFLQVSPDGGFTQGDFMLRRPGRLRFEYDPPSPYLVLADGFWLYFLDKELGEPQNWPIQDTPLGVLVAEKVDLLDNPDVEEVTRFPGRLVITLRDQKRPDEGTVSLVFSMAPLILRQWKIVDSQGQRTTVTLDKIETGMHLPATLFVMPSKKELDKTR